MIEMLSGKRPWSKQAQNGTELLALIKAGSTIFTTILLMLVEIPRIPEHLNQNCHDFIYLCLKLKKSERLSVRKLIAHPFIKDFQQGTAHDMKASQGINNKIPISEAKPSLI